MNDGMTYAGLVSDHTGMLADSTPQPAPKRPAAPEGVTVPDGYVWDPRFNAPIPESWDGNEIARQLALRRSQPMPATWRA